MMVKPPVLLPGELVVTYVEPAAGLYRSLEKISRLPGIIDSSMLVGMAWTDFPHSRASAIVIADGEKNCDKAYAEACNLAKAYWDRRKDFHFEAEAVPINEAVEIAKESTDKPVVISDSGDNVTAGAPGDLPILLEYLLASGIENAAVGGILDPEAVELCRKVGVGKKIRLEVGGKIDRVNGHPVSIEGKVITVKKDGAVLRTNSVDVILTNVRRAWASPEGFRYFGVEPVDKDVVVVKLGYLTPSFRKIAKRAILALSPGCTNLLIENLEYRSVERPLYPLDKDFIWTPPR
ncbi:hypothetical protein B6U74_04550 [Candidatus Bathyarchaeota archaeon ex4484_205]|nr:MAG: hypothetical protein B6U74_04550 [Candidatus Bathyarchaeota archaeon ex4484_205]